MIYNDFTPGYVVEFCRDLAQSLVETHGREGALTLALSRVKNATESRHRVNWQFIARYIVIHYKPAKE